MYIYIDLLLHVGRHMCVYIYMCIYMHMYMYMYMCMYMYVYMYMRVYIYIYICDFTAFRDVVPNKLHILSLKWLKTTNRLHNYERQSRTHVTKALCLLHCLRHPDDAWIMGWT